MSTVPAAQERLPSLERAVAKLAEEFRGIYGSETIQRFLSASYDDLRATATVTTFLPLLAERFSRERLHARAKAEGHVEGKPAVLFVCVHNAGRSQMALGFFRQLAGDGALGWSGGSEPGTEIDPVVRQVMEERGIDLTGEFPKPWTDETVQAADVVITMGCGDACPIFPGKRYEEWELDDPAGQTPDAVRRLRDQIEARVRSLLTELHVEVVAPAGPAGR